MGLEAKSISHLWKCGALNASVEVRCITLHLWKCGALNASAEVRCIKCICGSAVHYITPVEVRCIKCIHFGYFMWRVANRYCFPARHLTFLTHECRLISSVKKEDHADRKALFTINKDKQGMPLSYPLCCNIVSTLI